MADNTTLPTGSGGDVIATDDVTTLNGGASSGVKVQRVKVQYGDDGTARDASDAFPLPVALKASHRTQRAWTATFTAATTEGLITLTPQTDGANGTTGTSFVVTNGKRLKLTGLTVHTRNAGAAVQAAIVNLRINNAGAVTTTSPLLASAVAGTGVATANASNGMTVPLDIDILGDGTKQIGISQIGTATANNTVTLHGYEY